MLEFSSVNLTSSKQKYSALNKKRVAFKNNQAGVVAATPLQAPTVADGGLKNLINLVPNSYIDEIAGTALIAGIAAIARGKGKGLAKATSDNEKLAETVGKLTDEVKDLGRKTVAMGADEIKKLMGDDVVRRGDLDKKAGEIAADVTHGVLSRSGQEVDAKIAAQMSRISSFPTKTVTVNGRELTLAKMINPIRHANEAGKITPEYQAFVDELHSQSAMSVLGLRKYSKPATATPWIRMVAVELKPFTSVGGLSSIPKEMAEELPKILNQAKDAPRIILDTPLYKGCVGRPKGDNIYVDVVKDAVGDGYTYVQREGSKVNKYKLSLIDELDVSLVGEKNQHVRLFQTEPILAKESVLGEDTRKLFKPDLLGEIDTTIATKKASASSQDGITFVRENGVTKMSYKKDAEYTLDDKTSLFDEELVKKLKTDLKPDKPIENDEFKFYVKEFKQEDGQDKRVFYFSPKKDAVDKDISGKQVPSSINKKLISGTSFETDNYRVYKQDGKDFFQAKLTYNLWDNEKFSMEIPNDRVPEIYTDEAFHSSLVGRVTYFCKYLYEQTLHMMQNNETGQCVKNGKAVLGADTFVLNDWHTGPLAAMLRLGTVAKKHQHSLNPQVAEKVTNMPVVSLLHNIYDQKTGDRGQIEKMLNIMFGEDAAEILPHAWMPNSSINGKGGLAMNLENGCMSRALDSNDSCLSPLNMLSMYSDSMHPVSDGYAKECASMVERGQEFVPLFHLRTKEGMNADQIKTIAANNGINVSELGLTDEQLTRSTFYGVTNGLNKVNNIMTSDDLDALKKDGFKGTFKALTDDVTSTPESALAWHESNKKSALTNFIEAVNSATGREKSGKLNAWLGDTTDLTGVTADTPVFTTAGRITEQKGYETYMGAIEEYVKTQPKDADFPVFITQGELAKNSKYAMSVVELIENTKAKLTKDGYKKAADRIVLLDRGDGSRYTITKLVTDMDAMASNYEPCGLTHKEFMNKAGGLAVCNMTGGIPSGLPDSTIVKVPFNPNATQEVKSKNFALGIQEAVDKFKDKTQYAKAVQESLNLDFTWAKKGGPGFEYVEAIQSKGAIPVSKATA